MGGGAWQGLSHRYLGACHTFSRRKPSSSRPERKEEMVTALNYRNLQSSFTTLMLNLKSFSNFSNLMFITDLIFFNLALLCVMYMKHP